MVAGSATMTTLFLSVPIRGANGPTSQACRVVDVDDEYQAFDALPFPVREMLREAIETCSSTDAAKLCGEDGAGLARCLRALRKAEAESLEEHRAEVEAACASPSLPQQPGAAVLASRRPSPEFLRQRARTLAMLRKSRVSPSRKIPRRVG